MAHFSWERWWGPYVHLTRMRRLREIIQFVKCTLHGLSYLHSLRIVHRDICDQNVVVNCHSPGATLKEFPELLDEHRKADDVTYAFIDFGQSLQLPPETSIIDCRRPGDETAIAMNRFKPPDGRLAEPYYNPFSYDVAALGFVYRYYFSEAVTAFPGLAALFDRMTDWCPSRRMTAQEVLQWFEELIAKVPPATLDAGVVLLPNFGAIREEGFYWTKLSPEDQLRWGRYRTPPSPWWRRLLGWIAKQQIGWRVLYFVREALQI
ncbi:hypothetical protein BN946_scf184855.g10 [Trametes cinnabarina]|uniref:Protein kinase domain-containing protein n=1 Tax=Pycnoporus cinnabarinus TaxID=5643 RepID=A0A060SLL9_PYCCI|nr:hypothetical protein BN946_scf184855.g10 [Trametes cinnabarina]